jgi:hypothetical protein
MILRLKIRGILCESADLSLAVVVLVLQAAVLVEERRQLRLQLTHTL